MAKQANPPTINSPVREIFLRALDVDDLDQRATLIEEACGDNAEVRTEVEALLREKDEVGGFLESPAVVKPTEPPKIGLSLARREAEIQEVSGDRIGPFKLLQPLGEGGCGTVYQAEQSEPVRRVVALKIIKLGMDTKSVIARFESERQALALMDHPNIAKVLDAGATDTGRPFFVMELVRGMPITEYCDRRRLPTGERLRLFVQVCNAIQHAHQKGIIHRDIKPTNILVAENDGEPIPKVIDFGIAKATEQRLTEMTLFTSVESFIGTPTYMSPEQAEVSGLDIDTRSDIYSLGILLYELLVGQPPFDAAELRQLPLDEVRRTIRDVEPERPSSRLNSMPDDQSTRIAEHHDTEPSKLANLLRGDLDWIVIKCLEKDRARRYATANALVSDIERYLAAKPVLARPPSTIYRARKLLRRHGTAIAAGSLLFLTMLAGIAISTTQAVRATRAEKEAQQGKDLQESLRARAEREGEQAMASAAAAKLNEYVADINLTQLALSEGNFGRARQLIDKHLPLPGAADLRGFEWYYLAKLCQGDEHASLPNQEAPVQGLAFSPDGRTLAIALPEEVRLWNVPQRRRITSLPGGATSLLFLPDGHTLVSSDQDSTWVVDTLSWREVTELRGNTGPLALSADGSQLATSSREGIRIWDTADWFERLRLPAASGPRAFSPDGQFLAATGNQGIALWSLRNARPTVVLNDSAGLFNSLGSNFNAIAFAADGSRLIAPRNTTSERGVFVMSIWDTRSGEELGVLPNLPGHTGTIVDLETFARGNLMASASWDHSIGMWDLTAGENLAQLSGHSGEVWSVAISPDGRTIASGSKNGDVYLWPTSPTPASETVARKLTPLTFSRDNLKLAAADANSMTIYNLPGLSPEKTVRFDPGSAVSADLSTLARPVADGTVEILNLETREKQELKVSSSRIEFITLSADGRLLLTRCQREKMCWWDLEKPEEPVASLSAEAATISADGTKLAAFGLGDLVEIWDIGLQQQLRTLKIPQSYGSDVAISPDGSLLATTAGFSDSNNLVNLWDTSSGALIGSCAGHKQNVRSLVFSPDGRTLATASNDGTMKLWNVSTRQELISIRRLGTSLRHLAFSPDGQWLVGGSSPTAPVGELRFFHAPKGG